MLRFSPTPGAETEPELLTEPEFETEPEFDTEPEFESDAEEEELTEAVAATAAALTDALEFAGMVITVRDGWSLLKIHPPQIWLNKGKIASLVFLLPVSLQISREGRECRNF